MWDAYNHSQTKSVNYYSSLRDFKEGREGGKTNFLQMAAAAEMRGMVNLLLTLCIEVAGHVFCR